MPNSTSSKILEVLQDSRKVRFLEFLAKPKQDRGRTQQEFAKEIQVSPQTLSEWKKDAGLQSELVKMIKRKSVYRAPEILAGLEKKALRGDAHAVRLWFQFALGWSEKRSIAIEGAQNPVRVIKVVRRK